LSESRKIIHTFIKNYPSEVFQSGIINDINEIIKKVRREIKIDDIRVTVVPAMSAQELCDETKLAEFRDYSIEEVTALISKTQEGRTRMYGMFISRDEKLISSFEIIFTVKTEIIECKYIFTNKHIGDIYFLEITPKSS
jgi:2-methylcitrate dehydratase PrpD